MSKLSQSAAHRRREDVAEVSRIIDIFGFLHILLVGGVLLLRQMAHKLTPNQRAAYIAVSIAVGGSLIAFMVMFNLVWLALATVFLLGVIIGEISRM